MQKENCSILRQ